MNAGLSGNEHMAISHLFRDMTFVRAGRSQLYGSYEEVHINGRSCDLPLGGA